MADLTIPKGQTYPHIRGYVADEVGALPLDDADTLELVLENSTNDTLSLDVTAEDDTMIVNGTELPVNFQADYSATDLSDDETDWQAKLKITWSAGLIQYAPKDGFITITITENVTEA